MSPRTFHHFGKSLRTLIPASVVILGCMRASSTEPDTQLSQAQQLSGCYRFTLGPDQNNPSGSEGQTWDVRLLPRRPGSKDYDPGEPYSFCMFLARPAHTSENRSPFELGCWDPHGVRGFHIKWHQPNSNYDLTVELVGPRLLGKWRYDGDVMLLGGWPEGDVIAERFSCPREGITTR